MRGTLTDKYRRRDRLTREERSGPVLLHETQKERGTGTCRRDVVGAVCEISISALDRRDARETRRPTVTL